MREISSYKRGSERFFAYARERHATYLRRRDGYTGEVYSLDKILQEYRFTNVFRELDKTTLWFNKNVRGPLRDRPEVLLATVLFRMLNRIEVGEAIFLQPCLPGGPGEPSMTAFEEYLAGSGVAALKRSIHQYVGKKGPFVTGAYIISTPPGYKKLDGALHIVDGFARKSKWRDMAEAMMLSGDGTLGAHSLEQIYDWLTTFPYLGKFHSYEIVTDLRHTKLLARAPDVNSWANLGPGARRGLNRIAGRKKEGDGRKVWGTKMPAEFSRGEMVALLALSRDSTNWPQPARGRMRGDTCGFDRPGDWPKWELREVEHTLCEFDKYERVRNGEGAPRGRFP